MPEWRKDLGKLMTQDGIVLRAGQIWKTHAGFEYELRYEIEGMWWAKLVAFPDNYPAERGINDVTDINIGRPGKHTFKTGWTPIFLGMYCGQCGNWVMEKTLDYLCSPCRSTRGA